MAWIKLTQGQRTQVDAADLTMLRKYDWCATWCKGDRRWRAVAYPAGDTIYMHRLIMGVGPGALVDHRSRDTLDNRRANLRQCSKAQNAWNSRRRIRNKTSRYKGVSRHRKCAPGRPWLATITVGGRQHFLGHHPTQAAAARAYDAAATIHFGEFALLNFARTA